MINVNPEDFSARIGGQIFPWGIPVLVILPPWSSYSSHNRWILRSRDEEELDPLSAAPGQMRLKRVHEWHGEDPRSEGELKKIKEQAEKIRAERAKEIISNRV